MDALPERYVELMTSGENAERARRLNPIFERDVFGKKILTFEGIGRDQLQGLGEVRTPGIADLFVAKVKGAAA
jgi:ABC-2 type transport system ATP-binding protein